MFAANFDDGLNDGWFVVDNNDAAHESVGEGFRENKNRCS
jgi:hypothetical protein